MSADAAAFFKRHPDLEVIDLLIPDINGIVRGKKISASLAPKAFEDGVLLPRSLYALDVCGDTVEETQLGIATGDQDYVCRPDPSTLRLVPWTPVKAAQCLMEMYDEKNQPFHSGPRNLLRKLVTAMHAEGLYPTVAVELEFYLFRDKLDAGGRPQLLLDPVSGVEARSTQVYSMDDLDNYRSFIETVQDYCQQQSVPASAAIAEYAPGQFEINLHHGNDPVAACDDAVNLKRIIKLVARAQGMTATFMAKPMADLTGSGMHIHASICDANGKNRFAASDDELKAAVGGLQATMPESMLLYAPHANSYRRYQKKAYVPLSPTWGYNNRTVALRIPAGPEQARRIEHRVAGADANPYLVMAGVLAGILHGHRKAIKPDAPIEGDAATQTEPTLPTDWFDAIGRFRQSAWAAEYFGQDFVEFYTTIKQSEYASFSSDIPPLDIQWYFQTV